MTDDTPGFLVRPPEELIGTDPDDWTDHQKVVFEDWVDGLFDALELPTTS